MQRFLLKTSHLWEKQIILDDEEIVYQLVKVLRSKTWDEVLFFDYNNFTDFKYKISSIDKKNIIFSLLEKIQKPKEDYNIILFQALPNKIDKIEEIINAWTQVWYREFNFFRSERSQDLKISENKLERFRKIVSESSELSNRNIVPEINFLDQVILKNISGTKIFFHTDSEKSEKLKDLNLDFSKEINVFIWPEWWFSPKENEEFLKNDFIKVNLWNNILRTEVAPVVVWFYILQK